MFIVDSDGAVLGKYLEFNFFYSQSSYKASTQNVKTKLLLM